MGGHQVVEAHQEVGSHQEMGGHQVIGCHQVVGGHQAESTAKDCEWGKALGTRVTAPRYHQDYNRGEFS